MIELHRYRTGIERAIIKGRMNYMVGRVPDQQVDRLLGIQADNLHTTHKIELINRYGLEVFNSDQTGYKTIQEAFGVVRPSVDDVVYDFGSGAGRVVLYGALTTPAAFKGLELVEERVAASDKARKKLGIGNALFVQTRVQDYDFSDGTVFYMFASLLQGAMIATRERLRLVAQTKQIRIVTYCAHQSFEDQTWLDTIYDNTHEVLGTYSVGLRVFLSKAA